VQVHEQAVVDRGGVTEVEPVEAVGAKCSLTPDHQQCRIPGIGNAVAMGPSLLDHRWNLP
jgi:hypothetical protein